MLVDENKTCISLGIDIFFLIEVLALTLEVGVGSFSFSLNAFSSSFFLKLNHIRQLDESVYSPFSIHESPTFLYKKSH